MSDVRAPRWTSSIAAMLRTIAFTALGAALFALLGVLMGGDAAWAPRAFLIAFIYASVIRAAAHLVMPRVAARLAPRPPRVYWLGVGATLLGLGVIGAVVAGALVAALGLFGTGSTWAAFRSSFGIALILTLTVGVAIAMYETTRARLDTTRESLRQRELEMERAQRLATDARLASLESRLHPHFLFNAIAAIAGQVREAPEHAERLLVEFADLLRASLDSTQRHTVPLEDEVTIVRAYLEIEQARLGERLRIAIDVPDELRAWPIPPFALHTLVQNSVKHVAAARTEGAEIRVRARRQGDRLALTVRDDGPGFDLAAIPPGHGLETLRTRLAVLFGAGAGLDVAHEAGGARVSMLVPADLAVGEPR